MKIRHELFLRRQKLMAQIESQRMELNQAYRQLEKPIHLGEQAMKGFGFLRRNPWIAMAAPGVTSLLFSGVGMLLRRGKPVLKAERPTHDEIIAALKAEGEEMKAKSKKPVRKVLGYAIKAFQLYRKYRPLIPL